MEQSKIIDKFWTYQSPLIIWQTMSGAWSNITKTSILLVTPRPRRTPMQEYRMSTTFLVRLCQDRDFYDTLRRTLRVSSRIVYRYWCRKDLVCSDMSNLQKVRFCEKDLLPMSGREVVFVYADDPCSTKYVLMQTRSMLVEHALANGEAEQKWKPQCFQWLPHSRSSSVQQCRERSRLSDMLSRTVRHKA